MSGGPRTRVVLSEFPPATGWDTVTLMAELLAMCLSAELVRVPHDASSARWRRAAARVPRRRGADVTIVVAPQPVHLYAVLDAHHWTRGSGVVAGWVVDAFWTDRIPAVARGRTHVDHLFVTDDEVVGDWRRATGIPTTWLPFGADVLDRGSSSGDRPVDVQRVGRQPEGWDDDAVTSQRLAADGIRYAGRPPFAHDPRRNQEGLLAAMAGAKLTLSFTNRLSPAGYTHPTREYLTGRWLDAVANGATVAGVAPRCAATERLLWPEATVDLGGADIDSGSARLVEAVASWTPERSSLNHRRALERVDWRWRFQELADVLSLDAPVLRAELARLRAAAEAAGSAAHPEGRLALETPDHARKDPV